MSSFEGQSPCKDHRNTALLSAKKCSEGKFASNIVVEEFVPSAHFPPEAAQERADNYLFAISHDLSLQTCVRTITPSGNSPHTSKKCTDKRRQRFLSSFVDINKYRIGQADEDQTIFYYMHLTSLTYYTCRYWKLASKVLEILRTEVRGREGRASPPNGEFLVDFHSMRKEKHGEGTECFLMHEETHALHPFTPLFRIDADIRSISFRTDVCL